MYIDIRGCKLFFDVYGSKLNILKDAVTIKSALLVLHGGHGLADHTLYPEFWSEFQDIAQVVFLDQRGCGRSECDDPQQWNLAQWGEDIYLFCEALSIQKPIIAGVSMGGHVMCEYITHHPEHPGGLIFCNTEARFIIDDICEALRKKGGDEAADIARLQFTLPTPKIAAKYQKLCIPYYAKNAYSPTEIGRCKQKIEIFNHYIKNEVNKFDYLGELHNIQCPTLFMVGAESPFHLPKRALEMAEKIRPELVQLEIFEGAGAAVYKDAPETSLEVVRKFIEAI
jgi:pimeloyl-ACP methyl ester carboxylesterase